MNRGSSDIRLLREITNRPRQLMLFCLLAIAASLWGALLAYSVDGRNFSLLDLCRADPTWQPSFVFGLSTCLWLAMSLAMMLPAGIPMVSTYMNIVDAATEKHIRVVPASVLVAGYLSIWTAFSLLAAAAQYILSLAQELQIGGTRSVAVLFCLAGMYQWAPLKQACLAKCRAPLPYFISNWTDKTTNIFRMGLAQGLYCIGCCWALMLLMLFSGGMNLVLMAVFSALMVLEKILPNAKPLSYGTGVGFVAVGVAVLIFG